MRAGPGHVPPAEKAKQPRILLPLLALACAAPVQADQYAYMTLPQATEALAVLAANKEVHEFCAPCGDTRSKRVVVRLLEIGRVWDGKGATVYRSDGRSYWEVFVNDQSIDLAYVYVSEHGRWQNLALSLGLDASKVPRHLDESQIGD